jgi:hypothetical protein
VAPRTALSQYFEVSCEARTEVRAAVLIVWMVRLAWPFMAELLGRVTAVVVPCCCRKGWTEPR